jgi:hypothetical protein
MEAQTETKPVEVTTETQPEVATSTVQQQPVVESKPKSGFKKIACIGCVVLLILLLICGSIGGFFLYRVSKIKKTVDSNREGNKELVDKYNSYVKGFKSTKDIFTSANAEADMNSNKSKLQEVKSANQKQKETIKDLEAKELQAWKGKLETLVSETDKFVEFDEAYIDTLLEYKKALDESRKNEEKFQNSSLNFSKIGKQQYLSDLNTIIKDSTDLRERMKDGLKGDSLGIYKEYGLKGLNTFINYVNDVASSVVKDDSNAIITASRRYQQEITNLSKELDRKRSEYVTKQESLAKNVTNAQDQVKDEYEKLNEIYRTK